MAILGNAGGGGCAKVDLVACPSSRVGSENEVVDSRWIWWVPELVPQRWTGTIILLLFREMGSGDLDV